MNAILETERLQLRAFTLDDTQFIMELLNSAGWLRFIGDKNVRTKEQAKSYLEKGPLKSYQENGFGLWLAEKKDDQTAVGMCGIVKREILETPDIGFAFLPQFYGKGYALEAARATLSYANNSLGIPVVSAITLADNAKSIRLLERLGLHFSKPFLIPNSKEALLLYSN
jgi:RimJ/RimL family protein N-acetyltransferase